MLANIGDRYEIVNELHSLAEGTLYLAKDVSLQRDVFVYVMEKEGVHSSDAFKHAFAQVSHFANQRFFHILNAGTTAQVAYVVFTAYSGMPLSEYLLQRKLNASEMLTMLFDLGISMQDAMEAKVSGFSVASNNLWITGDNHLLIVDYWSSATADEQGAKGISRLLYQLATRQTRVPASLDLFMERLSYELDDLPMDQKEPLLQVARRGYTGECSLFAFMLSLREILERSVRGGGEVARSSADAGTPIHTSTSAEPMNSATQQPVINKPVSKSASKPVSRPLEVEDTVDDEPDEPQAAGRNHKLWMIGSVAGLFAVIIAGFMWAGASSSTKEATSMPTEQSVAGAENSANSEAQQNNESNSAESTSGQGEGGSEPSEPSSEVGQDQGSNETGDQHSREPERQTESDNRNESEQPNSSGEQSSGNGSSTETDRTPVPGRPGAVDDNAPIESTDPTDPTDATDPTSTLDPNGTDPTTSVPDTPSEQGGTTATNEVVMPNLVGLTRDEAEKQIRAAGLKYDFEIKNSDEQPAGMVYQQEPAVDTALKKGQRIKFYVSREKK
ncbi:PASTA domain-containing protein [Paenibacillus sp. 481]|uniref:PASTA domain-containing protein n=1 Tax=Paenibacillus sp. 481 TaxID=2835869 RepID=UPI001E5C3FC8|nr:PASTA domain-containing protein [Paenibacillus sp. 481]UHA73795.1 PASTA domain-containing protein [Paenibacillus sp. 481]